LAQLNTKSAERIRKNCWDADFIYALFLVAC